MGKTPDEIRAEIAAARQQMADGVRGLASQVHPTVIKQQTVKQVKDSVTGKVNDFKTLIVDDAGIRWDRIGTIALTVATLLAVKSTVKGVWHKLHH